MLNAFKTDWSAVAALTKGLKLGVVNEAFVPDIPTQISTLNMLVAKYQQLVAAINADKDGQNVATLSDNLQPVFGDIQDSQTTLCAALAFQGLINSKTPLGQLQSPKDSPAHVCNPTLTQLSEKLSALVAAMEIDLVNGGLAFVTQEPISGAVLTATVTATVTPSAKK